MPEFICSMYLEYEPVPPTFSVTASRLFDQVWPRSSVPFWQNMRVVAPSTDAMLEKLRQEFVENLSRQSPVPDKSAWTVEPPLQADIWWIGNNNHTRASIVEYRAQGVEKQWTMDYGAASPTPIIVRAEWVEIRTL